MYFQKKPHTALLDTHDENDINVKHIMVVKEWYIV